MLFAAGVCAPAQTWTLTSAQTNGWASIACSADGTRMVACAGGCPLYELPSAIYVSPDGGATWAATGPTSYWASVASSADGTKLVAVAGTYSRYGGIFTSSDGGLTWSSNNLAAQRWKSVASSADGTRLFAATTTGLLYTTTNSGGLWTANSARTDVSFVAISADGTKLVALRWTWGAGSNQVFTSTDSGATWRTNWTRNDSVIARNWYSVASSADGRVLAAAEGSGNTFGHIYISPDSGATWTAGDLPLLSWQMIALSADGTKMVAAGWHDSGQPTGPVYTSTDSGRTWISNSIPIGAWSGVACSADGNKLAAVSAGEGVGSLGTGGIWTLQTPVPPPLNISWDGSNLGLSWLVPSTACVLEQNLDWSATNWVTVTNPPVLNLTNLQNRVEVMPSNSCGYFRLRAQ